ncbi:hypothetical protein RT99_05850 [Flavobacterium sp. MEB061]|uniref:hypothetical protein n=1 Tax=Flavobacterium sp. MEB061 TaxID=1587524 RepID=UPI0005AC96BD|nr:hypothetical protein [Flavobacterium sp. MEB061]KIQ22631.1 hypothetical protein RT99_05850 [Flavobacterium sp. MEB061]
MSLIKIIANDIELDFVKETLSIKTENNAFSRDFKVSATSYPFLIIENTKTNNALGTRDLASVKKKKIIQVTVFDGGLKYYGELQVLTYLTNFRKCNLKYSSVILSIMNKKIADFMPIVSVIPDEENPVPYAEETSGIVEGSNYWQTYPLSFLNKIFPEVKWQFPTMNWFNKFGVGLESDDEWYYFKNKINEYDQNGLILNTYELIDNDMIVKNKNVVSPQVFLLSPLYYALESIGFKAIGSVCENDFIKRLLFLSTRNNLTLTDYFKQVFPPLAKFDAGNHFFWSTNFFYEIFTPGTYYIKYRFEEKTFPENPYGVTFNIMFAGSLIFSYVYPSNSPDKVFEGIVEFEVTGEELTHQLVFGYSTQQNVMPVYSLSTLNNDNKYHQMHPTIQLGRFLPDWTFGKYLNEMQKLFNLEIIPDDFSQTLALNFNEDTIANSATYEIKKSLNMSSYDPTPYNAFLLKYENEEDTALWITTEGVEDFNTQSSDFSQTLGSNFKYVPVTSSADLSDALESKSGSGLMIYDPTNKPFISENYIGQTLKMTGAKGIYQMFWRLQLKFLLNSSAVELSGAFTETEKNKILKLKRIFIDHQEYFISTMESTETQQENFKIKFNLFSITF